MVTRDVTRAAAYAFYEKNNVAFFPLFDFKCEKRFRRKVLNKIFRYKLFYLPPNREESEKGSGRKTGGNRSGNEEFIVALSLENVPAPDNVERPKSIENPVHL